MTLEEIAAAARLFLKSKYCIDCSQLTVDEVYDGYAEGGIEHPSISFKTPAGAGIVIDNMSSLTETRDWTVWHPATTP